MHTRNEIEVGHPVAAHSIIDSTFKVEIVDTTKVPIARLSCRVLKAAAGFMEFTRLYSTQRNHTRLDSKCLIAGGMHLIF